MLPVELKDAEGSGRGVRVTSEGHVVTTDWQDVAARDAKASEVSRIRQTTGLLTTAAGSSDMTVDGSSTAVEFTLGASSTDLCRISEFRMVFHDSQMVITSNESRRFGSAASSPGLTNGLTLNVEQAGITANLFANPVVAIGNFYRYARSWGGSGIVNDAAAISASVDYLGVTLYLPFAPIVLFPGSQDRIVLTVQDDLTSLTLFEVQYYGTVESV